jgi:hypothetical protein
MNFDNIGSCYFEIQNKDNVKKNKKVYVSDKTNLSLLKEINDLKEEEFIQQIPNKDIERSVLYITGASGSGKSYYTSNFTKQYKKAYPKNMIYLFSSIGEDKVLDNLSNLKRLKLTPEFYQTDFTINDFQNSLCIFDDCDCITDKAMKHKLQGILNLLLEAGRKYNASVIYTSHLPTSGNDTKRILNECHSITFFTKSLGGRSLKYLLENYIGMDKEQIKKVKSLNSRWTTYIKSFPNTLIYEKGAYTL